VGHDGHAAADAALVVAVELAERLGADVHVVHCIAIEEFGVDPDTEQFESERDRNVAQERGRIEAALRDSAVVWSYHEERGEPSARLRHLADDLDALFIVVGASHQGVFHHLTGASVSRRLLHDQHRPVLVVPAPQT
jgi:nucleotide-binding universal stress UspA family protein